MVINSAGCFDTIKWKKKGEKNGRWMLYFKKRERVTKQNRKEKVSIPPKTISAFSLSMMCLLWSRSDNSSPWYSISYKWRITFSFVHLQLLLPWDNFLVRNSYHKEGEQDSLNILCYLFVKNQVYMAMGPVSLFLPFSLDFWLGRKKLIHKGRIPGMILLILLTELPSALDLIFMLLLF